VSAVDDQHSHNRDPRACLKPRLTISLQESGQQRMLSLGENVNDVNHIKPRQQREGLPIGKLSAENLRSLLSHPPKHDPRLLIGPQVGEDAAVIDLGDRYLVVTTDPITFATDHIGRYAVHFIANDVAVLGARPVWFLVVVMLLPESHTTPGLAETIMTDVRTTCDELGVTLGGGHTEITQGLDRRILVGQMIGEVAPTSLVRKTRIATGDQILLTRRVAIEGTAMLAREKLHSGVFQQPRLPTPASAIASLTGEKPPCASGLSEFFSY
jgi:selenophosphate synthase